MKTLSTPESIQQAANLLRQGGVVAFPTETVYGLGGDARNSEAIKRIFTIKGRPAEHPLIVHISTVHQLADWACDITASALRLAELFWPGPLTLILKKHPSVPMCVTGGQETVGLRIPDHPDARALLQAFGGGLAAPSANLFGRISPTTAAHVNDELGGLVDMVLDGGVCRVGLESTIISLVEERPRLLRSGGIPAEALSMALNGNLSLDPAIITIRTPGNLSSHYAPLTPLYVIKSADLKIFFTELTERSSETGVLLHSAVIADMAETLDFPYELMPTSPIEYARRLYAVMRQMDQRGHRALFVEKPPTAPEWSAINDRLCRASYRPQT